MSDFCSIHGRIHLTYSDSHIFNNEQFGKLTVSAFNWNIGSIRCHHQTGNDAGLHMDLPKIIEAAYNAGKEAGIAEVKSKCAAFLNYIQT